VKSDVVVKVILIIITLGGYYFRLLLSNRLFICGVFFLSEYGFSFVVNTDWAQEGLPFFC
jgi:hypothetical protein